MRNQINRPSRQTNQAKCVLQHKQPIGHFTDVCLVAWPLNESEAGVDLVLEISLLFLFKFMRTASFTYDTEETILEASGNWSIQKKPSVESDLTWNPAHTQMFVCRVTDIMLFAPTPARFPKDILSHTHQDINLILQGLTSAKTRELVFPSFAPARRTSTVYLVCFILGLTVVISYHFTS